MARAPPGYVAGMLARKSTNVRRRMAAGRPAAGDASSPAPVRPHGSYRRE